jgi:hypothetical protein
VRKENTLDRIDLPRGRWVRFGRPMYISDKRAFKALAQAEDMPYLDMMDGYLGILEPAVAEKSWDGPLDQVTEDELLTLSQGWQQQTEDAAVPPVNGTSSGTP